MSVLALYIIGQIVRIVRGISAGNPLSVLALYIIGQIVRIVKETSGGGAALCLCELRL